jgi:hypothetical protein
VRLASGLYRGYDGRATGSHLRRCSPAECEARRAALEGGDHAANDAFLAEGAVPISVSAGDVVLWDLNLLHRGWNPGGIERLTLHGSYVDATVPVMSHEIGQQRALESLLNHWWSKGSYAKGSHPHTHLGEFFRPLERYLAACPASGQDAGTMLSLLQDDRRRQWNRGASASAVAVGGSRAKL